MSNRTISVDRRGTKVIIKISEYCPVEGRTTSSDYLELSADEARSHASHLELCAKGADAETSRLNAEQLQNKRQKLEALKNEVTALEQEIAGKSAA